MIGTSANLRPSQAVHQACCLNGLLQQYMIYVYRGHDTTTQVLSPEELLHIKVGIKQVLIQQLEQKLHQQLLQG